MKGRLPRLYFFLLFVLPLWGIGQEPVTIHLTDKDGVPCLECYKLIQDRDNFIWLAGNTGLYSYNGESFTEHSITDQKGRSVFNLSEDDQGDIWCNNLHGQILKAPKGKALTLFKDLSDILKGNLPQLLHLDGKLVLSWSGGILVIDKSSGEIVFRYGNDILHSQVVGGRLLFVTQVGDIYQMAGNEMVLLHKSKTRSGFHNPYFFKIKGRLAISFIVDRKRQIHFIEPSGSFEPYPGFMELKNARIAQIGHLDEGLWFATDHGVLVYGLVEGEYQLLNHILKDVYVTSVLKDRDDNYWLSTLRSGVFLIPNISLKKVTLDGLEGSFSSIVETGSLLALSTTKGELVLIDPKSKAVVDTYRLPRKRAIGKIFYDPFEHSIVISTNGFGSYRLDLKTKRLIPEGKKYDVSKDLAFLDDSKTIYLTYNKAVLYDSPKSNGSDSKLILEKRPYAVVADTVSQDAYIAFIDELAHYDSLWNKTSIDYKNQSIFLSNLARTNDGVVWGSHQKYGLVGIKNKEVVKSFGPKDGLLGTNIQNLESDGNNLWINTQHGVQRVDTHSGVIKNITGREGMPNNLVDIAVTEDQIFAASQKEIYVFDKNVKGGFKEIKVPDMYFTHIKLNNRDTTLQNAYRLPHHINAISFDFHSNTFRSSEFVSYEYQLEGLDTTWLTTHKSPVTYESLPPGKFTFNIRPVSSDRKGKPLSVEVTIARPFWATWWFRLLSFIMVGVSVSLYFKYLMRKKEEEKQKEFSNLIKDKRLTNLKLENLRSQMNPHFMFNALNSIQLYIINNEKDLARTYLVKFSRLIRIYLEHGQKNEVTLAEELEALKLYLQLEKIRFEEKLDYRIQIAPEIDVNGTKIPSIFIQPYVENAIKHGLRRKVRQNQLNISFGLNDLQNELICTIQDNGIGIKASEEQQKQREHRPFANRANKERVELYNLKRSKKIQLDIIDLKIMGQQGTLVTINIPLQKNNHERYCN